MNCNREHWRGESTPRAITQAAWPKVGTGLADPDHGRGHAGRHGDLATYFGLAEHYGNRKLRAAESKTKRKESK
jgi:hypothetical protein